jgi:hypothetical protein
MMPTSDNHQLGSRPDDYHVIFRWERELGVQGVELLRGDRRSIGRPVLFKWAIRALRRCGRSSAGL